MTFDVGSTTVWGVLDVSPNPRYQRVHVQLHRTGKNNPQTINHFATTTTANNYDYYCT